MLDGVADAGAGGARDVHQIDAVWLEHVRWVTDHLQQRLDAAAHVAWGLAGLAGIFLALIAPIVLDGLEGTAAWLGVGAMGALTVAIVLLLVGAMPRKVGGINVVNYRALWKAHQRPTEGDTYTPADLERIEALLVEEQLQSRGPSSPLVDIVELITKRHQAIKHAIIATTTGAALLVIAVFLSISP